jgi:hypothetical protein
LKKKSSPSYRLQLANLQREAQLSVTAYFDVFFR